MKRIAIIGANSFLAIRLRKQLMLSNTINVDVYGKDISVCSENETCFAFYLPIDTIDYSRLLSCDAIVYCASAGVQSSIKIDENALYEVNYDEPIRMLEYLEAEGYRGTMITFGSYFEMGNNDTMKKYSEEDMMSTDGLLINDYARSKKKLTTYMSTANVSFKSYHLILGSIYGKGENENRVIPYIIKQIQNNKPIHISSGEQIRQYIHVDDVVALIIHLCANTIESGIYNASSFDSISIKELCMYIYHKMNATSAIEFGTLEKVDQQMKVLMLSINKVTARTSWRPLISLEQGINEYVK